MELEAGEESDRDIYASGRDATHALKPIGDPFGFDSFGES
jgi:hypothetical protein